MELDYRAAEGCPSEAAFLAEVETRTKWTTSKGRTFVVRLERRGKKTQGSFTIDEVGTQGEPRVIEAATCEEAMRAIALSVALAVEAEPEPPPAPVVIVATPTPPPPATAPPPAAPPPPGPYRFSVGIGVEGLGFAAPGLVGAWAVEVGVRLIPLFDLRFSFRHSFAFDTVTNGATQTTLTWNTGRFEPCVGELALGPLAVGPCAFVELGQMRATGTAQGGTSQGTFWAALGAVGRADLAFGGRFVLRTTLGPIVPLDRPTIAYEPSFFRLSGAEHRDRGQRRYRREIPLTCRFRDPRARARTCLDRA